MWRNVVCGALSIILPVSLIADDTGTAMLRSDGRTLVDGKYAPASAAIFRTNLIRTPKEVGARIETVGSFADIGPETMVQFDGDELALDHGSIAVNTSRLLRVRVGCVTVTPVNVAWTNYTVTDRDGAVKVDGLKSDVYIDARSSDPKKAKSGHSDRTIVHEGEQKSRSEKCGAGDAKSSGALPGKGAWMNSIPAKVTGVVLIGLTCLGLCHDDDPISPSHP